MQTLLRFRAVTEDGRAGQDDCSLGAGWGVGSPQPGHRGLLEADQKPRLERRMGYWGAHHQLGIPGRRRNRYRWLSSPDPGIQLSLLHEYPGFSSFLKVPAPGSSLNLGIQTQSPPPLDTEVQTPTSSPKLGSLGFSPCLRPRCLGSWDLLTQT